MRFMDMGDGWGRINRDKRTRTEVGRGDSFADGKAWHIYICTKNETVI